MTMIGELHSKGEADLSEGHDGDTHGFESNPRATASRSDASRSLSAPREPRRGREP